MLSLTPDATQFGRFPDIGVVGPPRPGSDVAFEVRAFIADDSAGYEGPVTGSLNAALAQWLIPAGLRAEQLSGHPGTRLGRRGRVHISRGDEGVWVGGDTVVGITGQVDLPPDRPGGSRQQELGGKRVRGEAVQHLRTECLRSFGDRLGDGAQHR